MSLYLQRVRELRDEEDAEMLNQQIDHDLLDADETGSHENLIVAAQAADEEQFDCIGLAYTHRPENWE
jgi:hypothetical protein